MSLSTPRGGRPDTPSESARRAVVTAEDALTRARSYLINPKGLDEGHDLSHLVEMLDEVLADLAALREDLRKVASTEPPPDTFFETMLRVDQAFVDVMVKTHIEDWDPILHGPQDAVRAMVNEARGDANAAGSAT
jgi:hypothetical protein